MSASFYIIWTLAVVLLVLAMRKSKETVRQAGRISLDQAKILVLRMPLALLLGGFLVEIVPPQVMQQALGPETGVRGILLASVAGGLLPGGPNISFPLAVVFAKAGAGAPQMVSLLTGWCIWAFHRALNFEFPIMGRRFVALRIASSFAFPPLAGLVCMLAMHWLELDPLR